MIPLPSLTDSAASLGLAVLGIALVVAGTWLGRATAPTPNPATVSPDTVRVGRTITKRDTVTETVPTVVRKYDTVRTTDTVRVPVPDSFRFMGAIETRPVDVTQDEVTLTYFRDGRYMQNRYAIPRETWAIAPSVAAEATPGGVGATAALTVSRKSLAVSAGYEVAQGYHGWTVGLTWTPYKIEW
jgi:hypothetical protein